MQRVKFKLRNRYWLTYTNSPLFSERTHSLTVISQLSRTLISDMIILCKLRRISILFTNSTFSVFARQCIFLRVYFLSLQGCIPLDNIFFREGAWPLSVLARTIPACPHFFIQDDTPCLTLASVNVTAERVSLLKVKRFGKIDDCECRLTLAAVPQKSPSTRRRSIAKAKSTTAGRLSQSARTAAGARLPFRRA